MGFITKQWLKGSVERNRGRYPVPADLKLHSTTTSWCKRNRVAAEIGARCRYGDYQTMSLTTDELNEFLPTLAIGTDIEIRKRIARLTLLELRESDLLELLTDVLVKRRTIKLKKAAG